MRSFWQPVALARSVTPGQKIPITIMGEELMVYRGESGEAHVVAGRCAHRNALLSLGVVEDDCIRCFYHGWLYDSTGQCTEQVLERPNFARQIHIASYPVYEYLGLIFAYLGEGEPPAVPHYPEYDEGAVVSVRETYHPFNYYQSMENSVDPLHVPYVHRQSSHFAAAGSAQYRGGLDGMVADLVAEETEWGFTIRTTYDNGNCRVTNFEMPNIIHFTIPPKSVETG
jgi:5,5'-dehydrodivanillate O-demethylase